MLERRSLKYCKLRKEQSGMDDEVLIGRAALEQLLWPFLCTQCGRRSRSTIENSVAVVV